MTRIEEVLNRYVFWTDDLLEETRKEILRELERATEKLEAENLRLTEENISLRADVQILRNQLVKKTKALEEIRDHWANQYDHPRKENEMYRGSYGIGVTDGHRACTIIAERALSDEQGTPE